MGFADPVHAERLLGDLPVDETLLAAVAAAADPDLALSSLARLFTPSLQAALREDLEFRDRLIAVLGVSSGLADHLARHPADWKVLQDPEPPALDVRADSVPDLAAGTG